MAARDFPKEPSRRIVAPLTNDRARELYGDFKFREDTDRPKWVNITERGPGYVLKLVEVPELIGVPGFPTNGRILLHARAAQPFCELVRDWKTEGVLHHVKTWGGAYAPRLIRGGTSLSTHSWGVSFDVNAAWNGIGRTPAAPGDDGSVAALIPAAVRLGWYWGGWYRGRPDGMHFELSRPDGIGRDEWEDE